MGLSAIALDGLNRSLAQFQDAATRVANGTGASALAGDVVDLSAAAVSLLSARNEFAANLKALKAADDLERHTIDMLA